MQYNNSLESLKKTALTHIANNTAKGSGGEGEATGPLQILFILPWKPNFVQPGLPLNKRAQVDNLGSGSNCGTCNLEPYYFGDPERSINEA